jgi:hypothetical protein
MSSYDLSLSPVIAIEKGVEELVHAWCLEQAYCFITPTPHLLPDQ